MSLADRIQKNIELRRVVEQLREALNEAAFFTQGLGIDASVRAALAAADEVLK